MRQISPSSAGGLGATWPRWLRRGARVVLIEKQRVGGTCLNAGCIPTKVLTSVTELLVRAKQAGDFGLSIPQAAVDLPALMAYKRKTVEQLVGGVEQLLKARRVRLIHGEARLVKPDTISIEDGKGGREEVSAQRIILAPGSVTATPPIAGSSLLGVLTSTGALDIETVPARLVVVDGGVVGLEFACIYEALGSKVTVLEMTPGILSGATDEVIAKRLQVLLRRRGLEVQTGTVVQRIEQAGAALRIFGQSAGAGSATDCDRVLIATGRWPNTQGMGFAELGLRMNGRAIAVNERLATNLPNVWAAGDAIGGWMLAHKAMVDESLDGTGQPVKGASHV